VVGDQKKKRKSENRRKEGAQIVRAKSKRKRAAVRPKMKKGA